jgi:hypothetical protein
MPESGDKMAQRVKVTDLTDTLSPRLHNPGIGSGEDLE